MGDHAYLLQIHFSARAQSEDSKERKGFLIAVITHLPFHFIVTHSFLLSLSAVDGVVLGVANSLPRAEALRRRDINLLR